MESIPISPSAVTSEASLANTSYVALPEKATIVNGTLKIYGNDAYPVPYRRALALDAARARYPGFNQTTYYLKSGTLRLKGAKPLSCDIIFERDVAMTLRDGTIIYTDIFRPTGSQKVPAIVAWSPYGKEVGGQRLDDLPRRFGVAVDAASDLEKFEAADPAYWVAQGYAIINPDSRGSGMSEGNITYWGRQLAEDGYDFIEWTAQQAWSNGKVGMSGNSWLAISQWFIAAEQPPHLAAIAPWEGLTDLYRDVTNRGGIPAPAFEEMIMATLSGNNLIEDRARMIIKEPIISPYWQDKIAQLSKIKVPAYIVASYTNVLHTHGSFQAFRDISSTHKWLRVHNTNEWPDYYDSAHVQDLNKFFDCYLKNIDNGWKETPTVRLAVLDPGHEDQLNIPELTWPLPGLQNKALYLESTGILGNSNPGSTSSLSYTISSNSSSLSFSYTVSDSFDLIGYSKVRLWVEANGSDDIECEVTVQKTDTDGKPYVPADGTESSSTVSASGKLRVSMRNLDSNKSTALEPYLTFDREELLTPGEIVPIDISLWPIALRFHPGEHILLSISAVKPESTMADLGFGTATVPIPTAGGTFPQGASVSLLELGGSKDFPKYINEQRVSTPVSRNKGSHIFHIGGQYSSYLLFPYKSTVTL